MKEINLIGGFYKSKTLPWSAQDVVNWAPVPSRSGGTRSPLKLRGLPGLNPLSETIGPRAKGIVVVPVSGIDPEGGVVTVPLPDQYGPGDLVVIMRIQGSNPAAAGSIAGLPQNIGPDFALGSNASAFTTFSVWAAHRISAGMSPNIVWTPAVSSPQAFVGLFIFIPGAWWAGALTSVADRLDLFTTTTPTADFSSWTGDKALLCRFIIGPSIENSGIVSTPSPSDFSGIINTGSGVNQCSLAYTIRLVSPQNAPTVTFAATNPTQSLAATFPLRLNQLARA